MAESNPEPAAPVTPKPIRAKPVPPIAATGKAKSAAKAAVKSKASKSQAKPAAKKKPVKKVAKPKASLVKAAPRKLSPISREKVALRAYFIAEKRHRLGWPGSEHQDWLQAEAELLAERAAAAAKKKARPAVDR